MKGKVYLVGAGPGDPGLITKKGIECITDAEVIVYDFLASRTLLSFAPPDAEKIYAGKRGGDHTMTQDRINELLVEKASQGYTVCRLKGGDPFIFGRGGEEIEALITAGIPFEVVPGVTSAIAAPAYAGIPLTHRKYTSTVTFVTGHEDPTKNESMINWKALAETAGTLVFLMGVKNLPLIAQRLMECKVPPDKPVALIRWGTTTSQETLTGTLSNIAKKAADSGIKPPCIIVVGDVVSLREKMKWFEKKPLFGKRIIVTRARKQASELTAKLEKLGAECLESPVIRIVPPPDPTALQKAVTSLNEYDWIVFTSVNGVDAFFNVLFSSGLDARALGGIKTAAIGPATEKKMLSFGIKADMVPPDYRAESVVELFKEQGIAGKRILLPRAKEARPVLPAALREMGASVDEIAAYETICENSEGSLTISKLLQEKKIDLITFTSSSTVKNFVALLPPDNATKLLAGVKLAAIGPITAKTAHDLGLRMDIIAKTYTIPGLCDAICRFYTETQES